MKNLITLLAIFFVGWSASAETTSGYSNSYNYYDGQTFIFTEGPVEFSVFADGQFDFRYLGNQRNGVNVHVGSPNVNISFNAGYDYSPYIQRDDYGAVIQIEDVPIYYDYYGRIIQAGNIFITYNRFGIAQVGNLYINYNPYGTYVGTRGFINGYNRGYVYRPWHQYYVRPSISIVFGSPYRAYYSPTRYSYATHCDYYRNGWYKKHYKHDRYYRPGDRVNSYNRGQRLSTQRDLAQVRNRSNNSYSRSENTVSRSNREGLSNKRYRNNNQVISRGSDRSRSSNAGRATTTSRTNVHTRGNATGRSNDTKIRASSNKSRVKATTRTTRPNITSNESRSTNNTLRTRTATPVKNVTKSSSRSRPTAKRSSSVDNSRASSSRSSTSRRRGN